MARTYDLDDFALSDVTSADWALAYCRFALRDKPNPASAYPEGSLEDEELNALIAAQAITDTVATGGDDTVYYRPHRVAANILKSNPEWRERWSIASFSEARRSAADIARDIIDAGSWIDDDILDATDGRLGGESLGLRL